MKEVTLHEAGFTLAGFCSSEARLPAGSDCAWVNVLSEGFLMSLSRFAVQDCVPVDLNNNKYLLLAVTCKSSLPCDVHGCWLSLPSFCTGKVWWEIPVGRQRGLQCPDRRSEQSGHLK